MPLTKNKFVANYFKGISDISEKIDQKAVQSLAEAIKKIKSNKGRIFFLGVGGSAGNCSHAVNDFRKLCAIESYSVTDNVSELTARINDEGWDSSFSEWLKASNFNKKDGIFVLSVGGGNEEKKVSVNIINAIKYVEEVNSNIFGIVGRDGGYAKKNNNNVILIPNIENSLVTPLSESFQSVIWHCLVSNPVLQIVKTKW